MTFKERVVEQAKKLAGKSPEEIRADIEKEEIEETERLERLLSLAAAAKEYLEDTRQDDEKESDGQSLDS